MTSFIGPSEWQPGGRRTLLHRFFMQLFPLCVGLMLVRYFNQHVHINKAVFKKGALISYFEK